MLSRPIIHNFFVQVSPTYSREVAGNPVIAPHLYKFHGILNGIDPDMWDPFNDKFLPVSSSESKSVIFLICCLISRESINKNESTWPFYIGPRPYLQMGYVGLFWIDLFISWVPLTLSKGKRKWDPQHKRESRKRCRQKKPRILAEIGSKSHLQQRAF